VAVLGWVSQGPIVCVWPEAVGGDRRQGPFDVGLTTQEPRVERATHRGGQGTARRRYPTVGSQLEVDRRLFCK